MTSKGSHIGSTLQPRRLALHAVLLATCLIIPMNVWAASAKGGGAFKVVASPVKNPDYKELQKALDESKLLDVIADDLNETIALPFDIAITFEECGTVNAFYDPAARKISMCLELIENLSEVFHKKMDDQDAADEATINAAVFVLFHEVGHALVDALDLPITGREEDAVDQLSTYILTDGSDEGETAALDGAEFFVGDEEELDDLAFWDEHSLGQQRFYNIVCWVYGENPDKHKEMVGEEFLPESRAVRCPGEYAQMAKAWSRLLAPHTRDTVNLNMDGVRSAVRDGIASQMGLTVASVTCPESREMKVDDAFECTVAAQGGGRLVVKVTQKDDTGNIGWELARAEGLLDLARLEDQIKAGIKEQLNAEASVSCGGKFRSAEPGKTFDCKVTDATGGAATVTVTMNDAEGNTSWRLRQ